MTAHTTILHLHRTSLFIGIYPMTAVGFEATQLALVELEPTPSNHSRKLSCVCARWLGIVEDSTACQRVPKQKQKAKKFRIRPPAVRLERQASRADQAWLDIILWPCRCHRQRHSGKSRAAGSGGTRVAGPGRQLCQGILGTGSGCLLRRPPAILNSSAESKLA